jgi:hydroxyacylglutathione hydrolase
VESTNESIVKIKNILFPSNSYIIREKISDSCLLIDPGLDEEIIEEKINELKLKPIAILSTHGHFDHVAGVSFFKNKYSIPFYLHAADFKMLQAMNFYLKIARIGRKFDIPKVDVFFNAKSEVISIGDFELTIHNYPGHTEGSCLIEYERFIFTGDILYKKGLGLNSLPGEDKEKLKYSIQEIFRNFADDNLILPGHGESDYLLNIKGNNKELEQFLNL